MTERHLLFALRRARRWLTGTLERRRDALAGPRRGQRSPVHARLSAGLGVALLAALAACGTAIDDNGAESFDDLRARLTADAPLQCTIDRCCHARCDGSGGVDIENPVCETRATEDLSVSPRWASCDQVLFPEWFYANDCFMWTAETSFGDAPPPHSLTVIQCFCGRTETSYFGGFSGFLDEYPDTCDYRDVPEPEWVANLAALCASSGDACHEPTCTPDCSGRECGLDGCGGSCGTCTSGTCSAAGRCGSGTSTCSGCLSSCRGDILCCTGCGCYCEAECGGCW